MCRLAMTAVTVCLMAITLIMTSRGYADDPKQTTRPKRRPNPAMEAIEDLPRLPRVLLIGDSISIGYTLPVREMMQGKANVHRPLTNCGPTTKGIAEIDKWLGSGTWDVIHFNWGLHDLKYMGPEGQNLADPKASDSRRQVPIDEYEANLRKLVARLKKTGARLVWRSTTPIPTGAQGRVSGDSAKYNAVAKKIMDEHGIAIDDQYSFALPRLRALQRPANVHFTPAGSRELAKEVVAAINKALIPRPASGLASANAQSDWPRWRGPHDIGSTEVGTYPVKFDGRTTRWRAPLPGKGCSTPIVLNRIIYLTAPVNGKDALLAIDWSGDQQWRTTFGPEHAGKHRNGSGCNASPVTDGRAIFSYFKSGTLAAVELDGSVRWQTNLVQRFGKDERFWDHGTSPVLTDKYVVMARIQAGESWLAAFDKTSGELAWKVARNYSTPVECDQGYTTPLVMEHGGKEAVFVWGAQHITIHNTADGKADWWCGNFNPDSNKLWPAIATPVIVDDMAVICYGRNDRRQPRLYGIRLGGRGDVTASNHAWRRTDIGTFVPTPVAYGGRVYLVRDRGEVECIDPVTGKTVWSDAFPKGRAAFFASPIIAGGNLYAPREDGVVFVATVTNDHYELLAENDMDERVIGSPVPVLNRIFIRGVDHLFCLAREAEE
jgi:outer membrane protein assembly factor BamB